MKLTLAAILLASVSHAKAASVSDERCLAAATYYEAGSEPLRGVAATLQTIRNRARKRGMSVCDTIKERHQFSFYKRNKIAKNLPKKFLQKYKIAVTMRPVVESCTEFFHHKRIRPGWSRGRKGKQISNQIYYC